MFVGILAPFSVLDDTATLSPEASHKLVTEDNALGVGVDGYVDDFLVVKVLLEVVVEILEVGVRSVWHADHVCTTTLHEAEGIHLSLGDDAFFRASYGVDVVWDELCTRHELKLLVTRAVFDVDELFTSVVIKLNGIDFSLVLGHPFEPLCHLQGFQRLLADASGCEPSKRLLPDLMLL